MMDDNVGTEPAPARTGGRNSDPVISAFITLNPKTIGTRLNVSITHTRYASLKEENTQCHEASGAWNEKFWRTWTPVCKRG